MHIRRLATSPRGGGNMKRDIAKAIFKVALALLMVYIFTMKVY